MTNSAFVLDVSRPVPLEEFLLPAADMGIPSYRACIENPALSSKRHRIVRQPNATANEESFSSANLPNSRLRSSPSLPYPVLMQSRLYTLQMKAVHDVPLREPILVA